MTTGDRQRSTRWWSAPARTAWSPPTCSPTPAGAWWSWRRAEHAGGAVRSAPDHPAPGYTADLFSAFYPLAAASPVLGGMRLEEHGLRWAHAPAVLAHAPRRRPGGAALPRPGRDRGQRRRVRRRRRRRLAAAGSGGGARSNGRCSTRLLHPFPPVAPGAVDGPPARAGPARSGWPATACCRPAGSSARSSAARAPRCWSPATRCTPTCRRSAAGSALYGLLLAMLGQDHGFPVPEGGSGRLTDALVARLRGPGGELRCAAPVTSVVLGDTAVEGVGARLRRADPRPGVACSPTYPPRTCTATLVGDRPPVRPAARATWTASSGTTPPSRSTGRRPSPIPWRSPERPAPARCTSAAASTSLTRCGADLATGTVPDRPFVLLGQMTTTDPTRSPAGTESAWAYAHLPRGVGDPPRSSPTSSAGSRTRSSGTPPASATSSSARSVQSPADLEAADPALDGGALNGGTAAAAPAAGLPAHSRPRPGRHPVPRAVPRRLLGAPRRRRARRLRRQRRARRAAAQPGRCPGLRRLGRRRPAVPGLTDGPQGDPHEGAGPRGGLRWAGARDPARRTGSAGTPTSC